MLPAFFRAIFPDEGAARVPAASKYIAGKSAAAPFTLGIAQSSASF
jgi:hypothetical protein